MPRTLLVLVSMMSGQVSCCEGIITQTDGAGSTALLQSHSRSNGFDSCLSRYLGRSYFQPLHRLLPAPTPRPNSGLIEVYHNEVRAMAEPIYMRVGEGRSVELPELVGAMGNFLGLLREVDSAVAQKKTGFLRWKVTALERDPSPLVGVTPLLQRNAVDDTGFRVEREVITNVVSLTDKGERSRYLSDAALSRVEKIAKTATKIGESTIYTSQTGNVALSTKVTVKTFDQVREMTSIKSVSYGTIVGSLDSIFVHRGKEFRVWDENIKRPVRCRFDMRQESRAKDLLGKRVIVTGMIQADRYGQPVAMTVESLDGAELGNLPTIEEMVGLVPNFTGGLSLKEFFEDTD